MLAAVWSRGRESTAIPHSLVLLTLPTGRIMRNGTPHSGNAVHAAEAERDNRLMPSPYGTMHCGQGREA